MTGIQFTTVPNLNRMLLEHRRNLTAAEIDRRIKGAITDCFTMPRQRSQNQMRAAVFPSGADIPDNPDSVGLGVINYEWFTERDEGRLPALSNFYRNSPAGGGQSPRQYKNNFVVLVADRDASGDMERHARRSLAARYIKDNPPDSLQKHQLDSLETELASAEMDLFVAIQKLYVNLLPSINGPPHRPRNAVAPCAHKPRSRIRKAWRGTVCRHANTWPAGASSSPLENADLDPASYWKRRSNLMRGKVGLVSLKEEFAREPGNYMLLNGGVADALLRKALDRGAIIIQTGAGQTIAEGTGLLRTDDSEAWVYLKDHACPDCLLYKDDCRCGKEEPQLCPLCGKEQHTGQCETDQPQGTLFEAPPAFNSGLDPRPLNVLATEFGRHMKQHNLTAADIANVTLGGDKAEFINFVGSVLGQGCQATVSYDLRRGNDLSLKVSGMEMAEWSSLLGPHCPRAGAAQRFKDTWQPASAFPEMPTSQSSWNTCCVNFPAAIWLAWRPPLNDGPRSDPYRT